MKNREQTITDMINEIKSMNQDQLKKLVADLRKEKDAHLPEMADAIEIVLIKNSVN
jgi:hypothetical protein|tara:strand:+ start:304 stop:471 length:168 start_codon:yes stop_codon:yes gene_type:complete